MSHDHIGVPKFIEKGFSINNSVYCYNLINDKCYGNSIDRLGTKNNYYDEDVEKTLLANKIECQFSIFYNDFINAKTSDELVALVKNNNAVIEQFFSFMYLRSMKTLNEINKESITAKIFGDISHSELLRINSLINVNPFKIIGESYSFYPLLNLSSINFINNSVGYSILINQNEKISFFIPLTTNKGILITNNENLKNKEWTYIEKDALESIEHMNKTICRTEKVIGNGFIFGDAKVLVKSYIDYIKKIKS